MSCMKRFAEDVSVSMGYDGELTDDVLVEAQRRLERFCAGEKENTIMSTTRLYHSHAGRDEECEWCGYPFDQGQQVLADGQDRVFCGLACAELQHDQNKREIEADACEDEDDVDVDGAIALLTKIADDNFKDRHGTD